MPVGNSDRGVGLGAGEIMLFVDYNQQTFDWWHEIIPDAYIPYTNLPENFEHYGLLENETMNLGLTIGLNDYWNVTISQMLSKRCMTWEAEDGTWQSENEAGFNSEYHEVGQSKSVHHRTECSSSDFIGNDGEIKAFGGLTADMRINFKYLLQNTGKGVGNRIFIGTGLVVPSNNTLTESPWTKTVWDHDGDGEIDPQEKYYSPHRHFYLSDGVYKIYTEMQFFKKRAKIPVFWGGTFGYEFPLNKSDYGFTPSKRYEISLLALSGPIKAIKTNFFELTSIGLNLSIIHATESEWNNQGKTPNSEATAIIPGVSILFGSKIGTFGINFQTGHEQYASNLGSLEEKTDITSITISYRRLIDHVIDALYW